ncbi:hypothetical protein PTKIN_Ptkin14bG0176400 [Pterospermum kingtungense]
MKVLIQLYFVLCFLLLSFHIHVDSSLLSTLSSNSSATTQFCPHDQSFALLQLKNSLSIDASSSRCPRNKIISWKEGKNCCLWDGVKCETETGNVIGLDLSSSCLSGTIHNNSTLFHLRHLQELNVAHNDFSSSQMASKFGQFTNLTHLNISESGFTGTVPLEISHLSKLLSVDLSYNYDLIFEEHVFEKLVGNLTQLQHLLLDRVNMSSVVTTSFLNMSSYITTLTLYDNGLQGKFPVDVFRFPCLQKLSLINNFELEVNFPKSNWSAPLVSLEVSYVNASLGELPDSIGNLRSLEVLDLSSSKLKGSVPAALGNLTRLSYLDLSENLFHGPISFSFSNFKQLSHLDLFLCHLNGSIPTSLGNLTQLIHLSLGNNQFSGPFPFSAFNLTQIETLDFSENKLEGPLPTYINGLSRLQELHLDSNFLSGEIPPWLFSLLSLDELRLSNNKLTGSINQFDKVASLRIVFLGNNEIDGPIPNFSKFVNLTSLDLSSNKLNGIFELSKFSKLEFLSLSNTAVVLSLTNRSNGNYSFPNLGGLDLSYCNLSEFPDVVRNLQDLSLLDLSYNTIRMIEAGMFLKLEKLETLDLSSNSLLSVSNKSDVGLVLPNLRELNLSSCNITEVPNFLTTQESLMDLDLSNNFIQGQISKEKTKWGKNLVSLSLEKNYLTVLEDYPWTQVQVLNLRSNQLEGPFLVPPHSILSFSISDNKLTGEIPSSICDLVSLKVLHLSNNSLSGAIPECLGKLLHLSVMDLQMNHFHGNIPDSFVEGNVLRSINLNKNNFDGPLPKSLINCHELEVLNLGNNKINDTFPHWLGTLPKLQVLVLRANYFHGQIIQSENESHFSTLRILDLSHNEFSGFLPTTYFKSLMGMRSLSDVQRLYMPGSSYFYTYDISETNTSTEGFISDVQDSVIVTMKGADFELKRIPIIFTAIDMSSNNFQGKIPEIVGNLTSLQVLNFSHNKLTGPIPSSFGNLIALESLDLSSNRLTGMIPMQLTTLNFLAVLNLSENQLVGVIPQGKQFNTFPNDSYVGNLGLCGFPLSKICGPDEPLAPPVFHEESDSSFGLDWKFVLMGYGCGMVFGFSAGYVMLTLQKPKWLVKMVQRLGNKVLSRLMRYR